MGRSVGARQAVSREQRAVKQAGRQAGWQASKCASTRGEVGVMKKVCVLFLIGLGVPKLVSLDSAMCVCCTVSLGHRPP